MSQPSGDAEMLKALVSAGELLLSVATAVGGALWGLHTWLAARREQLAKEQEQRAAEIRQNETRLAQDKAAAEQRRTERAAELVLAFGRAETPEQRMWSAMALSLYPDQTLPLLAMALGRIEETSTTGIETALATLGARSLPELARINRLAVSLLGLLADNAPAAVTTAPPTPAEAPDDLTTAAQCQLTRTRRVINQILLHATHDELAEADLAGVDLADGCFRSARLEGACFRKTNLTGANFSRAALRRAVFRGARLTEALFTRANLAHADLTGAVGPVHCIATLARGATFRHCEFKASNFDGADLTEAYLDPADFSEARLNGADLGRAHLVGTNLDRVVARAIRLHDVTASDLHLQNAQCVEANWRTTVIKDGVLTAVNLGSADISDSKFINCDLRGAQLRQATLKNITFERCQLEGASFIGAILESCTFQDCVFAATVFDDATLRSVSFAGRCELVGRPVSFLGVQMNEVTFSDASRALQPQPA
ncbi:MULTISPECIES: pentapeptide repeat-containing protein [unclassified Bradyrhizobium]|uniref:pentapeptide repeat-containing protein n=1 Tax=unclassified Bradyrhizobium TaxID=2631580 RepID=UPI0028ED97AE|nr:MULTISPECIES: pentapeptide repeat-containing protein [unclassified Bradyrhizobium]